MPDSRDLQGETSTSKYPGDDTSHANAAWACFAVAPASPKASSCQPASGLSVQRVCLALPLPRTERLMLFWSVFFLLGTCSAHLLHQRWPLRLPFPPSAQPCSHSSAPPSLQQEKYCWNKSYRVLYRTKKILLLWLPAQNIHVALPWPYVPLVKGMFHY